MCMKRWKNVAGPTNVPGRTCRAVLPADSAVASPRVDQCANNHCLSWGDPHVHPFDGGDRTDIYSVGKYIYSVPTPYALDVLGSPMWQVATETQRKGTVALNKKLLFSFDDQSGQTTYEFNLSPKEWIMRVNGGSWTKVDTNQDRV